MILARPDTRLTRLKWTPFLAAVGCVVLLSVAAYGGLVPGWVAAHNVDKVLHGTMTLTLTFLLGRLLRGRVVLQFNIHKNGQITDIAVVGPSDINAFNLAANNAILGSNPTEPLPPEYPEPRAFFTVTFYYNENPPN